ncbi:hypothetical protein FHS75_003519 [Novosphingobium marinum]|uniref:Uncharacterized protein n=1 Tax=Novosphingobium marinum TaxID=1514948 RepID=A0A7Z0BWB4_9SPHN|nr:hypothetical protein [Novosphingobium marinum]
MTADNHARYCALNRRPASANSGRFRDRSLGQFHLALQPRPTHILNHGKSIDSVWRSVSPNARRRRFR